MTGIPPLSRSQSVDVISSAGLTVAVEASEAERKAMARLMQIVALDKVNAELTATREGDRIRVLGVVNAVAHQACVVTLEPVIEVVSEPIEIVFAPREEAEALMRKAGVPNDDDIDEMNLDDIDLSAIDLDMLSNPDALPEPIIDGSIDFGQICYDAVALALDPYPRKPGVVFEPPKEPEGFGSPFAALKALKPKS